MKLSVIVPCYNEAQHIEGLLDAVRRIDIPMEIIVVDDGSTDETPAILKGYAKRHPILLHLCPQNQGKGMAIRIGLEQATGDVVVIQDADMEYDPLELPKVIQPILDGKADVVYGSRFRGQIKGMRLRNRIANYILTWTANLLYRAHITDEATCYKAFRADLIKNLPLKCTRFEFCPEVTARIRKRGVPIAEVPIAYQGRDTASGKKITWSDGFSAIWTLVKYRFRN